MTHTVNKIMKIVADSFLVEWPIDWFANDQAGLQTVLDTWLYCDTGKKRWDHSGSLAPAAPCCAEEKNAADTEQKELLDFLSLKCSVPQKKRCNIFSNSDNSMIIFRDKMLTYLSTYQLFSLQDFTFHAKYLPLLDIYSILQLICLTQETSNNHLYSKCVIGSN